MQTTRKKSDTKSESSVESDAARSRLLAVLAERKFAMLQSFVLLRARELYASSFARQCGFWEGLLDHKSE